jgi:hypothetical protein
MNLEKLSNLVSTVFSSDTIPCPKIVEFFFSTLVIGVHDLTWTDLQNHLVIFYAIGTEEVIAIEVLFKLWCLK